MIEINLLPNVKREYIKSQQTKHVVLIGSVITSIVSISLLVLLFSYVQFVQTRHQKNLQSDIDSAITTLKENKEAVKVVTVQGALEQLPTLENQEKASSRLFSYLTAMTPQQVSYNDVKVDFASSTIALNGSASTVERANMLANNIKGAKFTYQVNNQAQSLTPFSTVVFAGLNKNEEATDGKLVSFQLTFTFDPAIFDQSGSDPKIEVNANSELLVLPTAKPFSETPATTGGAN